MKISRSHRLAALLLAPALAGSAPAQDLDWTVQFGTSANENISALAPGGNGASYAAGSTTGPLAAPPPASADAFVTLRSPSGAALWTRQLGTPGSDDCHAAAPDGEGGVFIAGETFGDLGGASAGLFDAWVARYDASGALLWLEQFGGASTEGITSLVPDGSGGVFACGHTGSALEGIGAGNTDYFVARFDAQGSRLWLQQHGSEGRDHLWAAAPDGAGGVFLAGDTSGDLGGPITSPMDAWIARYDASGTRLWIRQFGSGSVEGANALASDGVGGAYVGGSTYGDLGAPNAGQLDAWVVRFDGAGDRTWTRQFGTSERETLFAMSEDGSGGVYVAGEVPIPSDPFPNGNTDVWITRFDASGDQWWSRRIGGSAYDSVEAAMPDGAGGLLLAGNTWGTIGNGSSGGIDAWIARVESVLAAPYCGPAVVNSTGLPGKLSARGTSFVGANDVTLSARDLPPGTLGLFATSTTQGLVPFAGGSQGRLCLSGDIGRFTAPGQVSQADASGALELAIDLTRLPNQAGFAAAQAGQTWHFQVWYRDTNPVPTSNFTSGLAVEFR